MMNRQMISYVLEPVEDGFMARNTSCKTATAFGKTKKEAGDNLILAIRDYLNRYPDKARDVLSANFKKVDL